jgi:putative FmdB family regulatory protein
MYEFRCVDCHTKFEELVYETADLADVTCPSCSSSQVTKQLSAFAVMGGTSDVGGSAGSGSDGFDGGCATGGCCSGGACGF